MVLKVSSRLKICIVYHKKNTISTEEFVHRQLDFVHHDKESETTRRDPQTKKAENENMALHIKHLKACRNKKQSAAFLTPPDSSLSSSSGSLSSGNSGERKQHPKRKPLRFKGHTTLIAIPRRKKLKTKKSPVTTTSSGSDSDCVPHKSNNSLGEINRIEGNSLYSSCKSS